MSDEHVDSVRALDAMIDWSQVALMGKGEVQLPKVPMRVVEAGATYCDHDRCYETHDTYLVLEIGDEGMFFRKEGAYNSQDGVVWRGGLQRVRPTQVSKRDWVRDL